MNKDYNFSASDGELIKITCFLNEQFFSEKTIIFIHGFKGFKDWGFVPYLGEYFAKNGYFVITFNFSHNGIGENEFEFTELDKFAKNTYSREIRELNEIIDAVNDGYFRLAKNLKIGLIGHSRGGAIAILSASQRRDLFAVATWAAISKFDRYSERQKSDWRKKGFFEALNTRTNQLMRLNVSLLDDMENNSAGSLNIENALRKLNCPLLIAHGDQDLAVPIEEAEQLYNWADKSKTEFLKLFGTGHTFGIEHPFAGSNEKFENLLSRTLKFFNLNME